MKYLVQNKHWEINKEYNLNKLLYLLIDRSNRNSFSGLVWTNNKNQCHRDYDLPSQFVSLSGELFWDKRDELHREKNPAYIGPNNKKEYWINGKYRNIY